MVRNSDNEMRHISQIGLNTQLSPKSELLHPCTGSIKSCGAPGLEWEQSTQETGGYCTGTVQNIQANLA